MGAILRVKKDGEWIDIPALVGKDGFSPTVSVVDEGDQITITVKDKNGEKTISYGKGAGDMLKSVYDADGDGVVDKAKVADNATNAVTAANAEKLGGQAPSAYRKTADQIDYNSDIKNKPTIPSVPPVDTAVTAGSGNPVSGGAVKEYVDGKTAGGLTSMTTLVQFPSTGWTLDMFGTGNYVQDIAIDAYESPLDLNKATDDIIADVKIPNLYKDEVREAWAELQDFEITEEGKLRGIFFTAPTVNIMVSLMRIRKGA